MQLSYKQKLFCYFFLIFAVFTVLIVWMQRNREKEYKTENLRNRLNSYAEIVAAGLPATGDAELFQASIEKLTLLLPGELRLTIIDEKGKVLYDNSVKGELPSENHLNRPEISSARIHGNGSVIRLSHTTGVEYYYYVRYNKPYYIRVALPYTLNLQDYLKGDSVFMYFILLLFFTALAMILYLADKFGKSVSTLNHFITDARNESLEYTQIRFPDSELGEIGKKIVANFRLLEESKTQLKEEQEKLIRHFHYSEEGICIFAPNRKKIYANSHFIQYINCMLNAPIPNPDDIFGTPEFKEVNIFLDQHIPVDPQSKNLPLFQDKIVRNGNHYSVRLLIFKDNSFEITINDTSATEKNRLLKHEMTNNIAHELKTPVSSIRGYVETLLGQDTIPPEKQQFFLQRSHAQILRLSDLIRDIALITKTEEASELFEQGQVKIREVVGEVVTDLQEQVEENCICVENRIPEAVEIEGNYTLIYAVFRNLIENAVHYAGKKISIVVDMFTEDDEFYYFSLSDTGTGIGEEHLSRIFDRFYRVNEGRSRKNGGSGLGLSIVKNAILFHKGRISAKNRQEGGLEFIFSLRKSLH